MLKIENFEVLGWEHVIRGMRNPMNSWDKSDSGICATQDSFGNAFQVGKKDHELMLKLRNAGTDHRKHMRMITVYLDITAPLYWWKEFDTYKVGTVANSCSTMHRIAGREFTLDDFSHEHLLSFNEDVFALTTHPEIEVTPKMALLTTMSVLNRAREKFIETNDKKYWWQMIQLLPTAYNQKRTIMLNYEVLANIYCSRRNHKLDEWHTLCDWIEELPYSNLISRKTGVL